MPGEFMGQETISPEQTAIQNTKFDGKMEQVPIEGIEGLFADGINQKDNLPIFNVDKEDFYQNMSHGRKRIRFKSGSAVQQFMQKSRYNRSFYIKHGDYIRKVK
ncbi:MAG TPA: hypothetical protein P5293_01265 [Bacteroidales bacterium]|nr:hypothetical protein [Bacteroidales bacterium]